MKRGELLRGEASLSAPFAIHHLPLQFEKVLVGLLLLLFFLTGIAYSLVVPPFETPDEIYHYAFARHLATGNGLPIQGPEKTGPWEHEGSQPPLYYSLVGLVTMGIDQSDFDEIAVLNPRANLGNPLYPGNKNLTLYSAQQRPLRGVNLAVRMGRWLSVLLGTLTVLLTYLLSRYAFPGDRWSRLLTTGLVATIPQFTFISASVSNDSIVSASSTAVLAYLAVLSERARRQRLIRWWEWVGLGLLLGLAALSKLQGLGLLPLTGIIVLLIARMQKDWWVILRAGLLLAGPVLVVAGWWYVRNWQLYGDLSGMENLLSINGLREEAVVWSALVGELRGLYISFWAIFGWFSILLPRWMYTFFDIVTAGAVLGVLATGLRTWQRGRQVLSERAVSVHGLIFLWVLLFSVLFAYWVSVSRGVQGRLLFPAISALAVIMAAGLRFWAGFLPPSWRPLFGVAIPLGLWSCSLFALTVLLPESYGLNHRARIVDVVPADVQPIGKVYGDGVELVAARLPARRFHPGEHVPVTLYFRTQKAQTQNHELFLQLLVPDNDDNIQLGNVTTHPGWGVLPLTLWRPGILYADTYQIPLTSEFAYHAPVLARLYVGFTASKATESESEGLLPVVGGGSKTDSRVIGTVAVSIREQARLRPPDMQLVRVNFGGVISLSGYLFPTELSGVTTRELPVMLFWEASGAPHANFTTAVQLFGADGEFVDSYDKPPAEIFPTSYWREGDVSLRRFPLPLPAELPAGEYQVRVGLYYSDRPDERVPIFDADRTVQDNLVLLGTIQIR